MTIFEAIILGIIQGLTEFLPVSSSGHLVIFPFLLRWEIPPSEAFIFDVLVQVATLIAVIAFFWDDLIAIVIAVGRGLITKKPLYSTQARLGWYIIIATVPASIIGLLFKDPIESAFNNPLVTAFFLLGTAALLVLAEKFGKRNRDLNNMDWLDAIWIGISQILALFPGMSRSGATITGGMTRNLDRPSAARFSFLMSIPVMLAAGLIASMDLIAMPDFTARLPVYIPGFIAAAVTGYLAIRWLIRFLTHYPLYIFSIYCVFLALLTITVYFVR